MRPPKDVVLRGLARMLGELLSAGLRSRCGGIMLRCGTEAPFTLVRFCESLTMCLRFETCFAFAIPLFSRRNVFGSLAVLFQNAV